MAEVERVEMINGMEASEFRRRFNDDGSPRKIVEPKEPKEPIETKVKAAKGSKKKAKPSAPPPAEPVTSADATAVDNEDDL